MVKMSKFVNFMRDYVFARSVIPIGIIVIAIGIYASTIYGDRKDYPRCEATVTDSELLSGVMQCLNWLTQGTDMAHQTMGP